MFFSRGFSIGRIRGINISIDYSWFIIFALLVFLLGSQLPLIVELPSGLWNWLAAVLIALLFFASVLIHELAHSIVARHDGLPVNNITLFVFGGVSQLEDEPRTPYQEFKMAVVGPLSSLALAVFFLAVASIADVYHQFLFYVAFTYLWVINAALAIFNLLPGFPLDGGRVFRAIAWGISGNLERATRIAATLGQIFGWVFIILGVASLFSPVLARYVTIWLALIGWFLVSAARSAYQQVVLREALRRVPVQDVMATPAVTVPATLSVEELVRDYFLRMSTSTLPVEQDGKLLGMVSLQDVRAVPREEWPVRSVGQIVEPLAQERMLRPDSDAWQAANEMSRTTADRVLVTDHGHVLGIITPEAIARWLQTHGRWARAT